jgi:hypothetical protein
MKTNAKWTVWGAVLLFACSTLVSSQQNPSARGNSTTGSTAWRLVGASQGKENAFSSSAVDWQAFSNFLQDQAPAQVKKISPGVFEISASMPVEAGEYGIVLRPVSKAMKFSGADIARNQGNGKVFNSVWSFEVK